jgi:hypothetical protein
MRCCVSLVCSSNVPGGGLQGPAEKCAASRSVCDHAGLPDGRVLNRITALAPAPVLPGEDQSLYAEMATRIVKEADPKDSIEELLIRDVIDLAWSGEPPRQDVKIAEKGLSPAPVEEDERLIDIFEGRKLEFARLERYERRALSRRKSAIRIFDDRRRT